MRNRSLPLFAACLLAASLLAGCPKKDETLDSARTSTKVTVQKANAVQKLSEQRVNDGNAVLDGK